MFWLTDRARGNSRSLGRAELSAWKAHGLCVVSRPAGTRASRGHHDREVSGLSRGAGSGLAVTVYFPQVFLQTERFGVFC